MQGNKCGSLHSSKCRQAVGQTPFVEIAIFFPVCIFGFFIKKKKKSGVCWHMNLSVFNSVSLINVSVFLLIPWCFYYYTSVLKLEIWDDNTSNWFSLMIIMILLIIIIIINQNCGKFFKFGFIMEYLNIFLFLQIVIEVLMDVVVWTGICGVLRVCIKSIQAVLATRVSPDKSGVILMGLPLYITWHFFSCNSKYTFSVLYI